MIKIIEINKYQLRQWIAEDEELQKVYHTNSEFNTILNCLINGVTEHDLLCLFKDICNNKDKLMKELINGSLYSKPQIIVTTTEHLKEVKEKFIDNN